MISYKRKLTAPTSSAELFKIVARTQGKDITEDEIEALSYIERCQLLNANPVVTAKHFQHRVETFLVKSFLVRVIQ